MASQKPSSAPSRFITSKSTVMKDIKEWANKSGNEEGPTLIIGAQLKDNITEQRMLESKLYDLSKERYKFIVQVQWQRKAFIDRQQRKTSVMKDLLKCVDISVQNKSTKLGDKVHAYRSLIEEHYPSKRLLRRRSSTESDDDYRAPSNVELSSSRQGSLPLYKTEPRPSSIQSQKDHKSDDDKRMTLPMIETTKAAHFTKPVPPKQQPSPALQFRAVHDQRFVRLETTLAPIHVHRPNVALKTFIGKSLQKETAEEVEVEQ